MLTPELLRSTPSVARHLRRHGAEDRNDDFYRFCFALFLLYFNRFVIKIFPANVSDMLAVYAGEPGMAQDSARRMSPETPPHRIQAPERQVDCSPKDGKGFLDYTPPRPRPRE